MGQYLDSVGVISEYVPNKICTYHFTGGPVVGESRFIFKPIEEGTRFITRSMIELKNLRMLDFAVRRKARRQVKDDLRKLKKILENKNDSTDYCGLCQANR
jgi:hypothetical protein